MPCWFPKVSFIVVLAAQSASPQTINATSEHQGGRILSIIDYGAVPDSVLYNVGESVWTFDEFEDRDTSVGFVDASVPKSEFFLASAALDNTQAFNYAIEIALPGDTILVPDEQSFTFMGGILATEKHFITIDIAGSAHFVHDLSTWPVSIGTDDDDNKTPYYDPGIMVTNCTFVTLTSSSKTRARAAVNYKKNEVYLVDSKTLRGGIVNGNGKGWWDDVIAGRIPNTIGDKRPPRLIYITESSDVKVEHLTLLNSPFWTLEVEAVRAEINDINVLVDRKYQAELLATLISTETERKLDEDIGIAFPFPIDDLPDWVLRRLRQPQDLNTDGIDLRGRDIWVHDCIIQNADDSVAVKPLHIVARSTNLPYCTTNVTVENMVLTGFGASIGSVGPVRGHNCVDGVIFRNISMPGTGKGIYIKSNGSDCKKGVSSQISNILYDGVSMFSPFWWPIWIGPQQQHEPNSKIGLKCPLLYPLPGSRRCPTQGCVIFENIALRNIKIYDPVLSPGVILGNSTNPIRNLTIENLHVHEKTWKGKWPFHEKRYPFQGRFKCVNTEGTCKNCHPPPGCLTEI